MAEVIWTESALSDINNIAEFISRDSEFYAKQFVKKLIDTILKLKDYPGKGKPLRELPNSGHPDNSVDIHFL